MYTWQDKLEWTWLVGSRGPHCKETHAVRPSTARLVFFFTITKSQCHRVYSPLLSVFFRIRGSSFQSTDSHLLLRFYCMHSNFQKDQDVSLSCFKYNVYCTSCRVHGWGTKQLEVSRQPTQLVYSLVKFVVSLPIKSHKYTANPRIPSAQMCMTGLAYPVKTPPMKI